MRVTFRCIDHRRGYGVYQINVDKVQIGAISEFKHSPWKIAVWDDYTAGLDNDKLARIRTAAEKKCTTLNILRRLTS